MRKSNATTNPISQNIKKYRKLNNMTQEELSCLLNLDTQYYAQLERGERNFTIEKIIRLCSIFNVGIESIIEIDSNKSPNTDEKIQHVSSLLEGLSFTQLTLIEKFITDIIPCIK